MDPCLYHAWLVAIRYSSSSRAFFALKFFGGSVAGALLGENILNIDFITPLLFSGPGDKNYF